MKIKIQQFLFQNHSWSIVGWNLADAFIKKGYEVHLVPTDTNKKCHMPEHLKKHIVHFPRDEYDMQISYTAMINFAQYLSKGDKNRFGIWNYETTILPKGFAKHHNYTDLMMPSSEFAKKIFVDNGVPENKVVAIPHGVNAEKIRSATPFKLQTKKKYRILANIAQPHIRKNIPGLFESYGKAFTKKDDVCLVIKINKQKTAEDVNQQFKVDFDVHYKHFLKKYKSHGDVEIVTKFVDNIGEIYNACNIVYSVTNSECFWLPGLEAMAAGCLTIAPNWGGQLEYMNNDNSMLIGGVEARADRKMQYWTQSPYAITFKPDLNEAANVLKEAVGNYDELMKKKLPNMEATVNKLSWDYIADKILGYTK